MNKTKWIPAGAALLGIILSFWVYHLTQFHPPENIFEIPPPVNPFAESVVAAGIVESENENIHIGTPAPGLVTKIYVKVSEPVKKGQPLFSLDTRDLSAKLDVQKGNIAVANARLEKAMDQLARLQSIKDRRALSVEEIKSKEFELEILKQELNVAKVTAAETEALINRMTITAPRDGIILQSNIHEGEYVGESTTKPGLILGDVINLQVRADVDEYNAFRISANSTAIAFPKNNSEIKIPLHFSRIEPFMIPKKSLTGSSDERIDTRVLQIIYDFDKPIDYNLYVGQQLDVYIEAKRSTPEKQ